MIPGRYIELDHATHPNKWFAEAKVIRGTERWLVVTTLEQRLEWLKATTEQAVGNNAEIWYFTTFE